MIYGICIKNFDVFDDDRLGILIDENKDAFRLRGLNALIGRNNTGKSSFINSMSFIKDTVIGGAAEAATMRGRPGFYKMLIDTEQPAEFSVFFKIMGSGTFASTRCGTLLRPEALKAEQILKP